MIFFALMLAACDGCHACSGGYWAWDPSGKSPLPAPSGSAALPLNALDCPDGLARCVDNVVEVSKLATIALPCSGPPDKCRCPWERVGACDHGCVVDDLDMAIPRERAFAQLCAPSAADVVARPPAAGVAVPSGVCGGELYRCTNGTIVVCNDGPGDPIALATCVRGCAEEASSLDEEGLTKDQVAALLCKH